MRRVLSALIGAAVLSYTTMAAASPIELITNGNFETGTFGGWTVDNQAGGDGTFFVDQPGALTPATGQPTQGSPANGSFYAVTDGGGPGTHVLRQTFTVLPGSTAILSFLMFVNDWDGGPFVDPAGLNFIPQPNQHARVDILTAGAGAFDTGVTVLDNFYLGVDGFGTHAFTSYSFDITSLVGAGGTFQLRFAEVDNQLFLNLGVDNVSILAEQTAAVPEPMSLILVGSGLAAGLVARRRRARSST
jgi:hypothetical protein